MSKQINMPKKVIFPTIGGKSKNAKFRYLQYGFEKIGAKIVYSNNLLKGIIKSEIYPFYMIFEGKETRVLLDVVASKYKKHMELLDDNTHCFKTHMDIEDLKLHPNLHPMPQSTSNLKIFRDIRTLRRTRKRTQHSLDVVAVFVNSDAGLRQQTVALIRKQGWRSKAHVIVHPRLERDPVPAGIKGEKLPYLEHLAAQSKSLLCVALPGARINQGASCSFRHVEIWAMGGCVLTIEPGTVQVGNPKDCWIEFKPDLSDFVEVVEDCIENPDKCEKVAANGLRYFGKHLTPEAHAMHIIKGVQK